MIPLDFFFSIALLLLLLYWSAWISSAETALFSLSSHTVKTYETDADPRKKLIADLLSHSRDLLVTVFMVNTCINILLQNVASDFFGTEAGWALKVGVPLVLTLIFGEIIPKYIGLQNNTAIAYRVAPPINKIQNGLRIIRKAVIAITTPISKMMFFFLKKEKAMSKEEIDHILETSEKHGIVHKEEAELLAGYLEMQKKEVKELMWPKEDILYYATSQPITKLVHLFVNEQRTRIPVCKDSIENVIGIINAVEFFKHQSQISEGKDLLPYLDKPFFTPETTTARALLKTLDENDQVLALVVDEYGSISGLISREDLIEVVIGHIEDSREKAQALYVPAGKNEVIASGKWELAELNAYFETDVKSENHLVTVGGYLTEQLGEIPKSGTQFETSDFLFKVLAATPTRITRLFIRKMGKKN